MKALRVRLLLLFPRFHASVKDSLESNPPEVCCFVCYFDQQGSNISGSSLTC
jgi:hypothetical protein